MKCPHCLNSFHEAWGDVDLGQDEIRDQESGNVIETHSWLVRHLICPECGRLVIEALDGLMNQERTPGGIPPLHTVVSTREFLVNPKAASRAPLDPSVPLDLVEDYREAVVVLADSPKASAALSRRCLQHLLRETANVEHGSLYDEIGQVLEKLPSYLSDALDGVRQVGNAAAHPIKSGQTGEVVAVEPGEAEWLLETLEGLFDFYFTAPARLKARRDALDEKLGKPAQRSAEPDKPESDESAAA
jgi:hypothetical protein